VSRSIVVNRGAWVAHVVELGGLEDGAAFRSLGLETVDLSEAVEERVRIEGRRLARGLGQPDEKELSRRVAERRVFDGTRAIR
jgi:hypothetical protein